ncbi:hypothetical protein DSM19430T_20980 [Desulfovibrio psychrotolerans]|uniref:Uncharacterized protein n=1 Tax=Desulfovibrio psychrotolerans TaxID=415242 RepID=A0A7J0BWR3_9BACT|nr:hypothetical protein DSM19430T_20980 [Desulfovibrio psychrotolerans]
MPVFPPGVLRKLFRELCGVFISALALKAADAPGWKQARAARLFRQRLAATAPHPCSWRRIVL